MVLVALTSSSLYQRQKSRLADHLALVEFVDTGRVFEVVHSRATDVGAIMIVQKWRVGITCDPGKFVNCRLVVYDLFKAGDRAQSAR